MNVKDADEPELSDNAVATLCARYLRKNAAGQIVETPGEMFRRVAGCAAAAENAYARSAGAARQLEQHFYEAMAHGLLLPNSPTLMNAGRRLGMLSACFVLPVDDSVEGIFESVKHAAQIQKAGGGTGFSFDRLRPTGDYIASSGGRTSGPISFWRVFCEATRAIQQGAFRRGANMGMMSIEHPDILKFITAKNAPGEFENFNISVKVGEQFMRDLAAAGDAPHVVVNPRDGSRYRLPKTIRVADYVLADLACAEGAPPGECYTRRDVFDLIVQAAWATGEPGLCFIDRINADNPTPRLGRIEATNPCGEQPLLDYEACNLASIDVSKFVVQRRLDEPALRKCIRLGVRLLDDVIDVNEYMVPQIAERCRGNRKIGLGLMGLADALFALGVRYDSDEGLTVGRRLAKLLRDEAFAASEALAHERGGFPNWAGSVWDVRHGRGMRNAAVTTIAPTGTLSILAGCTGGIEPAYALAFMRQVLEGRRLNEVNRSFRAWAQREGIWSEQFAERLASGESLREMGIARDAAELFVTAHEIAPAWHVRMQAAFQEFIDGAISKTINLPHEATPQDVADVCRLAHKSGCKGVTVYRDGCRAGQPMTDEQPSGSLRRSPDIAPPQRAACPRCRRPLTGDVGCSRCPTCGINLCSS